MMKRPGIRRLLFLLPVAAAALAGYLWFRYESSPARLVERMLRSLPGVEAGEVKEVSPGRVVTGPLRFHLPDAAVSGCKSAEIRFGADRRIEAVGTESMEISGLSGLLPLLTAAAAGGTRPPEITVSGMIVREKGKTRLSSDFRFTMKRAADGRYDVSLTLPRYGLTASGRYDVAARHVDLALRGKVAPELLDLLESRIPSELELSAPFDVDARLKLGFKSGAEPVVTFAGELAFPGGITVSGGVWAISPGSRASFRWNGRNRPWEVTLPATVLLRPLKLPLGALSVTGGTDSIIRFSVVNTPSAGETTGVMRLDGHYDRKDGSWIFRQSESADRPVRWSGELPFGNFDCAWRSPRISGGGSRSRGGIEFSFDFESFRCRTPGNPRELTIHPGTLSGNWTFDCSNPESSSFELSGLIRSGKLDWSDPESAWSASAAVVPFRYSRLAGEKTATLVLEPEFGGINLYGSGMPKLKLEGVTGRFQTGFDPAGADAFPLRVEGRAEVNRVNPVQSVFGTGEFRDLRLSGFVDLTASGMIQALRTAGSAGEALFRYPECEISAAQPEFDVRFDRNAVTPGDNFLGRLEAKRLALSAFGGSFSVPEGRAAWSGELRDDGLLPDVWRVSLDFPAGSAAGSEIAGTFRSLAGKAEFDHARLTRLEAVLNGFDARFGSAAAVRRVTAEKQTLVYTRGKAGGSGAFRAEGAAFRENGSGLEQISVELPLEWRENGVSGTGTLRAGNVTLPGGFIRSLTAALRLENGTLAASGGAASPFWPDGSLTWNGRLLWNGRWRLSGDFALKPVTLSAPLALGGILAAPSGLALSGGLSGKGGFELLPERMTWGCELAPDKAGLAGDGFAFADLSGTLRLAGSGTEGWNPGGEFRFGSFKAGPAEIRDGLLAFRLPRPGECDVLSGSGMVLGGRARLTAPFTFRFGSGAVEAGVAVRGLEWARLLEALGFDPELIGGRADGMLLWHLSPDGKSLCLGSAELTAVGPQRVKLEALEPYLASGKNADRRMLEFLRDFDCRSLRLRAEEEAGGGVLLELSVSGRPAGAAYRKLTRSVDPAAFGLDSEVDFTVNYRIPDWKKAKERK